MILVVYKDHRIEIEQEGNTFSYSIWDSEDYLVANDSVELPKKEVIRDCQMIVDEYIKTRSNLGDIWQQGKLITPAENSRFR